MSVDLTIERIGSAGDGIARHNERRVFVPFTVPGDRVRASIEGERAVLEEVLAPGPDRATPSCMHFGRCGGCALQHVTPSAYRRLKRVLVEEALARRGLEGIDVAETKLVPPGSRRRAAFRAVRTKGGAVIGFNERLSHHIVDLEVCSVLDPSIVALLPALRDMLFPVMVPGRPLRVLVTRADNGLDVAVNARRPLNGPGRAALAKAAMKAGLLRLAWSGEIIAEREAPMRRFGAVDVALPVGAFLQASSQGEALLQDFVNTGVGGAARVADLFCGCGTFALPLAARASVHAVDSNEAAVGALDHAVRHANGLKPLSVECRDLFRRPLRASELARFDAALFDPPRAGARAQAEEIAKSDVSRVIALSCDPGTFARDLRILVDGGYRVLSVTPVDQFLWSPEVEIAANLARD